MVQPVAASGHRQAAARAAHGRGAGGGGAAGPNQDAGEWASCSVPHLCGGTFVWGFPPQGLGMDGARYEETGRGGLVTRDFAMSYLPAAQAGGVRCMCVNA